MEGPPSAQIEKDISRLEKGLKQLKVQYDMFMVGAIPRQPFELRRAIERLIKRYSNAAIRKYHHRFHFNALVARYNSLSELWGKNLRAMEEGGRAGPAVAERPVRRERTLARCLVDEAGTDNGALRKLHASFVEARQRAGSGNGDVPFETFAKRIAAQARKLRESSGCEQVELRVVVQNQKVLMKARPGR